MKWNLFLDDERFPADDGRQWVICRSFDEVIDAVKDRGIRGLSYVSFDHDLGGDKTGYDVAKELVKWDVLVPGSICDEFDFYVHSQNPIGKRNIEQYLRGYLRFRSEQRAWEVGG